MRRNTSHISRYGFKDDRSNLFRILINKPFDGIDVVIGSYKRISSSAGSNARAIRGTEGQRPTPRSDKEGVAMTVITSVHLNKLTAPGVATRYANGRHSGFRSGVDHAELPQERKCLGSVLRMRIGA